MTKRDCVKLLYDSIKSSSSLKYNKDCYIFIAVLPSMPYKSFNAELTKATNLSEWTKLHYAEITDKEVSKPNIFTKIFTPDNKKILLNKLSLIFRKENQFNYKNFFHLIHKYFKYIPAVEFTDDSVKAADCIFEILTYFYQYIDADLLTKTYLCLSKAVPISQYDFCMIMFKLTEKRTRINYNLEYEYKNINTHKWHAIDFEKFDHLEISQKGIWKKDFSTYTNKKERTSVIKTLTVLLKSYFETNGYSIENSKTKDSLSQLNNYSNFAREKCNGTIESYRDLAVTLYECILKHIQSKSTENETTDFCKDSSEFRNTGKELEEYLSCIDIYGRENYDRFLVLSKKADTNAYAANELGDIYYFGKAFKLSGSKEIIISKDYLKAKEYYEKALTAKPYIGAAAYSLGYMYLRQLFEDYNENDSIELAEKYFITAKDAGIFAASHNLAEIKIKRAKRIYQKQKKVTASIYTYYEDAIRMLVESAENGWIYSWNLLGLIFDNDEVFNLIKKEFMSKNPTYINSASPLDFYQRAAEYGNPWALFKCGKINEANGNINAALEYYNAASKTGCEEADLCISKIKEKGNLPKI